MSKCLYHVKVQMLTLKFLHNQDKFASHITDRQTDRQTAV